MKSIINKFKTQQVRFHNNTIAIQNRVKSKLFDTRGDGYVDTAIKIIIGVVIGALVLAGLLLLWNNVIMPRLNTEINSMFNA